MDDDSKKRPDLTRITESGESADSGAPADFNDEVPEPPAFEPENELRPDDFAEAQPDVQNEQIAESSLRPSVLISPKASEPHPEIPAQFPFSLLIEGRLEPENRERLVELLNVHQMGIREIDLEPQFEAGRVLIPRISEYAGVLLVQALRSTVASLRFGPSEEIFTSPSDPQDAPVFEKKSAVSEVHANDRFSHPAEQIPITSGESVPGTHELHIVDTITASAAIQSKVVHADNSAEYQRILEALQRELKYKAHRKGAHALIRYALQLLPLSPPTHYRAMVTATAVTSNLHSDPTPVTLPIKDTPL